MNVCPFCKNHFEHKDILFFESRGSVVTQKKNKREDADFGGGISGRRGADNAVPANTHASVQREEIPAEAAEAFLGQWKIDTVYSETCSAYWKAGSLEEERFIVRWTEEEASPRRAEVNAWMMNQNGQKEAFPSSVRLCEADVEKSGIERGVLTKAMCPECHCQLPIEFLATPDENCHSIALIGYPSSGKTQFKLTLRDELVSTLQKRCRLVAKVQVFTDSEKVVSLEKEDFKDGMAAANKGDVVVFPMIFAVEANNGSTHLLTLYDMPGEAYEPERDTALAAHEGLKGVDGAILMIDAVQLYDQIRSANKVRVQKAEGGVMGEQVEQETQFVKEDVDITEPLDYLKMHGIGANLDYLAMVITKVDLLISDANIKYFGESKYQQQLEMCCSDVKKHHDQVVDAGTINKVDAQVMRVISEVERYKGMDVKKRICSKMAYGSKLKPESIRAFAISTLRRPDADIPSFIVQDDSRFVRHRVIEPMLYMMARWGVVETKFQSEGGWGPGTGIVVQPDVKPEPDEETTNEPVGFWERIFGRRGNKKKDD